MIKTIEVIINPAAGIDTPILSILNRVFKRYPFNWHISVTKNIDDVAVCIKQALMKHVDAIVICGGDGTVSAASKAMCKKKTPLIIVPQGSANVISKDLGIPSDIAHQFRRIYKGKYHILEVDMIKINNNLGLLGLNVGYFADAIVQTKRSMKNKVGQLAYSITAVSNLNTLDDKHLEITIGKKHMAIDGIICHIANIGNIGIPGVSIVPGVSATDGLLDVVVVKKMNLMTVVEWAQTTFSNKKPVGRDTLSHWRGKRIRLKVAPNLTVLRDDVIAKERIFDIKVIPHALRIVVPKA